MRISHTELETCRGNPKQWVAAKLSSGGGFSYGYNQAVKDAIYTFHRSNQPREGSKFLFEKLKKFKNTARKAQCEADLTGYLKWALDSKTIVAHCKIRLDLLLERSVVLGGEISRVDIVPEDDTYRAVILGDRPRDWRDELRFPLIQQEIGAKFHRPVEQVHVGFQNLDGSDLVTVRYAKRQILEALEEGEEIGRTITREMSRHGLKP